MSTVESPVATLRESSGLSECLDRLAARRHKERPLSTYRLQMHAGFSFQDGRRLLPYLKMLGISHCYTSPILQARPGSKHGYDITDHNFINSEIGGEQDLREFAAELKAQGMGLVLDVVPNHMDVGYGSNSWWEDVLENGPTSAYAGFFDIDWQPVKAQVAGKVLIPILGDQYGEELEQGRIRLRYQDGHFLITYHDKTLPIDPQTIPLIFEPGDETRETAEEPALSAEERTELDAVLFELRQLPPHTVSEPELMGRRRRAVPALKERLRGLTERSPRVLRLFEETVRLCNGTPGEPRSFDALHRLLEAQAYRVAHWRVSAEEINYRRFFDINDLVGLRMENPKVFAQTHRLIRRLLAEGLVGGLRIDHPDGLLNPVQYFTRVQTLHAAGQCLGAEPVPPLAENGIEKQVQEMFGQHEWMNRHAPLYLLAEKILEPGEELPRAWPVDGTVGYEFANLVNGVLIDGRNQRAFTNLYRRFLGTPLDAGKLVYENKKLIMRSALSSEVTVLSHMLEEICNSDRHARDFTRPLLTEAIRETCACFPVYRTYIDERGNISERDRAYIGEAIVRAKRRNPSTNSALFDFLRDILLLKTRTSGGGPEAYRNRLAFTLKFQQLTSPVMAKGLEDTAFYVYNRFVSLNEVGGSLEQFGIAVEEFHRANQVRAEQWPHSMLSTSTHDTKRSEDVRARLNVLSEMPKLWSAQVTRWRRANARRKRPHSDGRTVPDLNEEYLLYQTLVGTWPFAFSSPAQREEFIHRIQRYMNKAIHEAKVNLSWLNDDAEYVHALEHFVARALHPSTPGRPNTFLQQFEAFVPGVAFFGALNSLAQTLLKITSPGMPDIYQGCELWDLSLVDPDNRRPVDFRLRQDYLGDLNARAADSPSGLPGLCRELLESYRDGRIKLWTIFRALQFRQQHPAMFQEGAYLPLLGQGEKQDHLVAFAREDGGGRALVAVPRLAYTLMGGRPAAPLGEAWGDTELLVPPAGGEFINVFTGEKLQAGAGRALLCREVFAHFPVALLAGR